MRIFQLCTYALLIFMDTLCAKYDYSQLTVHYLFSQFNVYMEYSRLLVFPKRILSKEELVSWHIVRGTWRGADDSSNLENINPVKEGPASLSNCLDMMVKRKETLRQKFTFVALENGSAPSSSGLEDTFWRLIVYPSYLIF